MTFCKDSPLHGFVSFSGLEKGSSFLSNVEINKIKVQINAGRNTLRVELNSFPLGKINSLSFPPSLPLFLCQFI